MPADQSPALSRRRAAPASPRHVLDLVPMWFRSRRPLKRFYWQAEEIEEIRRGVREVRARWFGGDGGWPDA